MRLMNRLAIAAIHGYQMIWHPIYRSLADRGFPVHVCTLEPSCSEYAIMVFSQQDFKDACRQTWKHLLECQALARKRTSNRVTHSN